MRYFIFTLGCQMNKSDSERVAQILENLEYKKTDEEKDADLIAINACSVRQSAIDRVYGKIRLWNRIKAERSLITILTGCVLPADKKKFEEMFDLVMDIKELPKLAKKLRRHTPTLPQPLRRRGVRNVPPHHGGGEGEGFDYFSIKPLYSTTWSAYIPIMTGCNNFCSYCAVPYTRGREVSRPIAEVLTEIKEAVKNGCLEVVLLGQNVNTYNPKNFQFSIFNFQKNHKLQITNHKFQTNSKFQILYSKNNPYQTPFAALLWEINQIPELNRIHFTAPHPKDMNDEVIDSLTLPKMVNYLHLPAQSGDDEILRKMNRHYTSSEYLKLIKKIRRKKPDIAIGTDIIVGFPGETKKQFNNTVKLYKEAQFDISYTAKYSPRPGTAAAKLKDDVNKEEKKRRWEILQELMEKIVYKKNQRYVGKEVEVLVQESKKTRKQKGKILHEGNSREYKRVRFYSDKNLFGKIVKVKVKKAMTWMLEGDLI